MVNISGVATKVTLRIDTGRGCLTAVKLNFVPDFVFFSGLANFEVENKIQELQTGGDTID